ncbi:heparinase II/III family protein [Arthrobacter sp. CAN_C5]|uniref:heparinase II/III domain-containing protein n=1 Tax=Arthrobacter sp. CAN_C5 TaxID=2760706 RepID=UPI001AE5D66A|nr:heparinase II/III family protein [Arthrobacter sp. CAN_C5]MBP2216299.1 hypothetical protein [Arthrobacter sp. CAN_C5]
MNFIENGLLSSAQFDDLKYDNGAMWAAPYPRGQQRYLHGFIFLVDWFDTVLVNEQSAPEAARLATEVVEDWVDRYPNPQTDHPMAYHDETTAQRLMNLMSLDMRVQNYHPDLSQRVLQPLINTTADLLARDDFHAAGNNHGMFQDLALLYWSILSAPTEERRSAAYFDVAMNRLRNYFSECFTKDGVHVENTPTYHLMVSRHVANVQRIAVAAGHPDAPFYEELVKRAEIYAVHALMPDRTYPPISDTQQNDISRSGMQKIFTSEEFAYASSGGSTGRAPDARTLVLPDSGYAIYRSKWGDPNATFAFFSAAYNADYHKHSDDLSFFLRSAGVDLLSESGPYSYDYKDPLSKYAYSQFAHNSLVVDGRSLPRTDGKLNDVHLRSIDERDDGFTVVGTNARYEDVIHERKIDINEIDGFPQINVTDSITSPAKHHYQLLWNLGTDVDITLHGQGFELFHKNRKVMDLLVSADVATIITIREGVMKPRPLGWRFPKFGQAEPAKVVAISFTGPSATLTTSIRLSDFNYVDRGLAAQDSKWSRQDGKVPLNYLFSPGKTASGRNRLVVVFSAIQGVGDFTYNYKASIDAVDINALYILDDFGDQGSYYHSDHRSDTVFQAVQRLIKTIADREGVEVSDIVTVGSSKGGTAALLHGLALSVGRIVVGAPQTRIGSFVARPHPNILEFMAGGTSDSDVEYLDGLIDSAISKNNGTTAISILVGQNDHHLSHHVLPLSEKLAAKEITDTSLTILPDLSHADVGSVFRFFLAANLEQWVAKSSEEALAYILTTKESARSIRIKVYAPAETQISYRLFSGSEIVRRRSYSERDVVIFDDLAPGNYRVRVFRTEPGMTQPKAFTTRWINVE